MRRRPRAPRGVVFSAIALSILAAPLPGLAEGMAHDGHGAGMKHVEGMQHGGHGEGMHHGAHAGGMHGDGAHAGGMAGGGMDHGGHGEGDDWRPEGALPFEVGQGAFAAIAEIVALLQADPDTDWRRVDIPALAAHLRDMDALMTELLPRAEPIPGGARFTIHRDEPGGAAAWRMIPAHMPMVEAELGVSAGIAMEEGVLTLSVTGPEGAEAMIRGLGLQGLMATGAHHQPHHLAIASGRDPHAQGHAH
ncbi:hypothetical protein ACQ5SO_06660 [Rhodovulum sp. DZ06]|uniref:hypothetical protein n=1 Tax=Rhodovulum sp. DZ06 TaxID=3425126 RepID=UPI003D354B46